MSARAISTRPCASCAKKTGVTSVRLLGRTRDWLGYMFPPEHQGSKIGKGWRGQKQIWFALAFEGDDAEINLHAHGDDIEFDAWRWAELDEALDEVIDFKRDVYRQVIVALPSAGGAGPRRPLGPCPARWRRPRSRPHDPTPHPDDPRRLLRRLDLRRLRRAVPRRRPPGRRARPARTRRGRAARGGAGPVDDRLRRRGGAARIGPGGAADPARPLDGWAGQPDGGGEDAGGRRDPAGAFGPVGRRRLVDGGGGLRRQPLCAGSLLGAGDRAGLSELPPLRRRPVGETRAPRHLRPHAARERPRLVRDP